jgi:hypothetical protein
VLGTDTTAQPTDFVLHKRPAKVQSHNTSLGYTRYVQDGGSGGWNFADTVYIFLYFAVPRAGRRRAELAGGLKGIAALATAPVWFGFGRHWYLACLPLVGRRGHLDLISSGIPT